MSLLDDAKDTCVLLDKITTPDGYGGYYQRYVDGATFTAAFEYMSGVEGLTAQAQGVTSLYNIYTGREINLQYHDVLRRLSDGKLFRVTSDGDDKKTPKSAGLNLRMVSAEEWVLPNE